MGQSEFGIFPVKVGKGQVALSPIPGRSGSYENDLSVVLHWAPDLVFTMTTPPELDRMGATWFGDDLAAAGVGWVHLPIEDFGAPDAQVARAWEGASREAAAVLAKGGRILIHCFGGCGRSGMAALRLMVEAGELPTDALERLRTVRPCAVETDAQFDWAAGAHRA